MVSLLLNNPLVLLFTVAAIGYVLGRIRIRKAGLGSAAFLFAGLAAGYLRPDLKLPEIIYLLGQAVFMYTIGLSSGSSFFPSLKRGGVRANLLVVLIIGSDALLLAGAQKLLNLTPAVAVGLFAGTNTSTSALAGVLDFIRIHYAKGHLSADAIANLLAEPVIGYSIAYPMGVVGLILSVLIIERLFGVDYQAEARTMVDQPGAGAELHCQTILVTNPNAVGIPLIQLSSKNQFRVIFGRLIRVDRQTIPDVETSFLPGDRITICATKDEIQRVTDLLGKTANPAAETDGGLREYYRVFVSNPRVVGLKVGQLDLPHLLDAVVLRVRRGDLEFLPRSETVLEYGDRVRILTRPENKKAVAEFFGDSYRALGEIDVLTFAVGIAAGLILGLVPIPLPGGFAFNLGVAGGPLIAGLILGHLERSGPLVWNIPYGANRTLRQLGLVLFMTGIGITSGHAFSGGLEQRDVLTIFATGAFLTAISALAILVLGYKLLRIPINTLVGILAGAHTQPAILGFLQERTRNEMPTVGYASVVPLALILKIVLAQLLFTVLAGVPQ